MNPGGVNAWDEADDHRYIVERDVVRLYMYGSTSLYVGAQRAGPRLSFTLNGFEWTFERQPR